MAVCVKFRFKDTLKYFGNLNEFLATISFKNHKNDLDTRFLEKKFFLCFITRNLGCGET